MSFHYLAVNCCNRPNSPFDNANTVCAITIISMSLRFEAIGRYSRSKTLSFTEECVGKILIDLDAFSPRKSKI